MTKTTSFHSRVGEDGRIVIPAPARKELDLKPGDTVVIESDGHSLLLRSYAEIIKETQAYFRQFVQPGVSVVDELIAERQAEAARENAETEAWLAAHKHD
jgi:AbrB family transcriptional regulator (stage V sporulation protein T)